ncbi:MAG: flavin oxidoreductase/NADH oxidase [Clostridia bacterium]
MLPRYDNIDLLFEKSYINNKLIHNRIVFNPMEGCDANGDGSPSELVEKRYSGFAGGGAGIIWMEAVAICEDGKANPRQLYLNNANLDAFKKLVEDIKNKGIKQNGFEPVVIIQATHSGRYSKSSTGESRPQIAYNNPLFEKEPISRSNIVSDDYLQSLEDKYVDFAQLAMAAGFDGIDIKACHRYLVNELLSAYTREGLYGGSFENRTRLLRNSVEKVKAISKDGFIVTSRLNMYDGFPYPYGFGVRPDEGIDMDFTEGIKLVKTLKLPLINISIGNPYVNPEVNRPCNGTPLKEAYEKAVSNLLVAAKAANSAGDTQVVCSGISGLKADAPYVAAGAIFQGYCSYAGFGRMTFAYPNFVKNIKKGLEVNKCCITCGKCSELMRAGSKAGCVIRDKFYFELYKKDVMKKK